MFGNSFFIVGKGGKELGRQKIKYLVVGGLAVNLYGYDRITGDLDIILLMTDANVKRFIKVAEQFKLRPRVPVSLKDFAVPELRENWVKEKNMKAFTLYNPQNDAEHVDIIIDHPINFQKAYKKRKQIKSGGMNIALISLMDLIKMKKAAGRERDKVDIKALTFIKSRLGNIGGVKK